MPDLAVVEKETEFEQKALTIPDQVKALIITDSESYISMSDLMKAIDGLIEQVNEGYDDLIREAHLHHKKLIAKKARYADPLLLGKKEAKRRMEAYDAEQKKIAEAEAARLREEARKIEEQRLLNEALAAEAEGDKETLREIEEEMSRPVYVPPVYIPPATPKVSGVVFRTYYHHRVTNLKELVLAVSRGIAPIQCLKADDVFLGAQATSFKKEGILFPGVESYSERK